MLSVCKALLAERSQQSWFKNSPSMLEMTRNPRGWTVNLPYIPLSNDCSEAARIRGCCLTLFGQRDSLLVVEKK